MINPVHSNNTPKPVEHNPAPPPPPKVTEAPKKIDNSRFEGAITQAKGSSKPPIKLNFNQPAPAVIEPSASETNQNKLV